MSIPQQSPSRYRILILSHSAVVDVYQDKLRYLAREHDLEITLVVPHVFPEAGGVVQAHLGDGSYTVVPLHGRLARKGPQSKYTLRGLRRLMKRLQPHVLHLEEEPESLISLQAIRAALALRQPPKIVAFSWRNMIFPFSHWPWYKPKRIVLDLIQRMCLPHVDALICGSHEGPSTFASLGVTCPMHIIPQYGIDPARYSPEGPRIDIQSTYNIGNNELLVGFVGRIMPMKGLDTLLEACSLCGNNVHCVVIGRGDTGWLRTVAERTGMTSRLTIIDGLAPADVPSAMRALDVMVLPSKTTAQWREQFGRVIIEAMACGLPVVGSSSGEIPYVIGDAGLVFPEGDAKALASCIEQMSDPEARATIRRLGLERVEAHYTNERIAGQIAQVYRQVLTNAGV